MLPGFDLSTCGSGRLGKLTQGADSLLFSPALLVTLQVTLRIPPTLSRLQLLYLQKGGVRRDGWVGFGPFIFKPLTLGVLCVCQSASSNHKAGGVAAGLFEERAHALQMHSRWLR